MNATDFKTECDGLNKYHKNTPIQNIWSSAHLLFVFSNNTHQMQQPHRTNCPIRKKNI